MLDIMRKVGQVSWFHKSLPKQITDRLVWPALVGGGRWL